MNVNDIANLFSKIDSGLNKRNVLANNIEKSFKNKKMTFYRSLSLYMYILIITPLTILVFFNDNYIKNIIPNETVSYIVKSILLLFDAIPIYIIVMNVTSIKQYFSSEEFRVAKKEIYSKENEPLYIETKKQYKNFKWSRIKSYLFENVFPIVIIAAIVAIMYNYSLYNLIASVGIIIIFSLSFSIFYEREHSIHFYISDVEDNIDNNQLVDRELIRIDNINFYISNKEFNAYFFDNNKWFLLKYKASKFEKEDLRLFITYMNEYIDLLSEYKKSNMCREKVKVENTIKEFKKILATFNELV